MPVSQDYIDFVVEQLSMEVTAKRMFGGAGLYSAGILFGLIGDDVLYLKVDDAGREAFTDSGAEPFAPRGWPMSYFSVPAHVLDDPDELSLWARKALSVAARAKGLA